MNYTTIYHRIRAEKIILKDMFCKKTECKDKTRMVIHMLHNN
jgi:hypothetical protein